MRGLGFLRATGFALRLGLAGGAFVLGGCTYLVPDVGPLREPPAPGCTSGPGGAAADGGADADEGEDGEVYGPSDPYQNVNVGDARPGCGADT